MKTVAPADMKPDFEIEVERAVRHYMSDHDGHFPSRRNLLATLGGSLRDLNPVAKRVIERIREEQTALAALPEMPDAVREVNDRLAQAVWKAACEIANNDIEALRTLQCKREASQRAELADLEDVIDDLEEARDAERLRADGAEKQIRTLECRLEKANREISTLNGRLAERVELLESLRAEITQPDSARGSMRENNSEFDRHDSPDT
ncbi:MAG: DNA-binding protein [Thioclava marina]|uniref:DNA-binding protein n=1 Tax=Thioclava marina TaxID=1915077 RepID=UPI0019AADAC9|nr:DNA-binding protein [Thioclava marina]MBC7146173.1 DNA-binding protein [Thioclava marina]